MSEVSSSGRLPLIVSFRQDRKRVSSAKSPLVDQVPTSPTSSQMQKVEPSRIVIAMAYGSELLLTILEGELCARALTTSSSTLTWSGRVTANATHSAMSSGVSGSTFA